MRTSEVKRKTLETDITMNLNIDGKGLFNGTSGIGFFDHMLAQIAKQSLFDISLVAQGDLIVDCHHTIEDIGIVFGLALKQALGDSKIKRYGDTITPMDEALVSVVIDLCNRSNFSCEENYFTVPKLGDMDCEMVYEFFKAIASNAMINIHLLKFRGTNNHHICEAIFKGFGRSLAKACASTNLLMSTKGAL